LKLGKQQFGCAKIKRLRRMITDIRTARELTNWSQWELAKAAGVERTRLSLYECGHVLPTATELARIEQALLAEIGRQRVRLEDFMHAREQAQT
jgi:transcriptional regulator with XRE-family HTH domain